MSVDDWLNRTREACGRRYCDLYSKEKFLIECDKNMKLLDVGCGNNSPRLIKTLRPDVYYIGLDIQSYNHESDPCAYANEYI